MPAYIAQTPVHQIHFDSGKKWADLTDAEVTEKVAALERESGVSVQSVRTALGKVLWRNPTEVDAEAEKARVARGAALREFEEACNTIALVFGDSAQREVAIRARGQMREANGEAAT